MFVQNALKALSSAFERFRDCLRRRCQSPLKDRHCEADGISLIAFQPFGAIKAVDNVGGDASIEFRFERRQSVIDGIRNALRENRFAVESQQILFDEPPHDVRYVDGQIGSVRAFETVGVDERHEQSKIIILAVVRGGGQQ